MQFENVLTNPSLPVSGIAVSVRSESGHWKRIPAKLLRSQKQSQLNVSLASPMPVTSPIELAAVRF